MIKFTAVFFIFSPLMLIKKGAVGAPSVRKVPQAAFVSQLNIVA